MGLASGGNTTGSFDFELFRESGLIFFFFALVPVCSRNDKDASLACDSSHQRVELLPWGLRFLPYVDRMHRCLPLLLFWPPTGLAHYVGEALLCQERGRLIEKLKRKQISSIWFRRLCPLTMQANVPVAKQSTSHCASDNGGGRNHSVFVGLSHRFFRMFVFLY